MEDCIERTAVRDILGEDEPAEFIETIDTMFEAWICSDHSDGTSADQRGRVLNHFKALRRFLFRLQKEEKKKLKAKKKDLQWLE